MSRLFFSIIIAVTVLDTAAQTVVNVLPPQEGAKQKVMVEVENISTQPKSLPRRVALIVQNHASLGAHIPMMALTDALTAKLADNGFQVINPYNSVGINQNRSAAGERTPLVSAVELAKQLGADGVITASVIEFLDSPIGTPSVLHQFSVRVSFNLADVQTGAVVCGETIKVKSPKYTNNQIAQNRIEYLGDLLHSAAEECATKLKANPNVTLWIPEPPPSSPPPSEPKRPLFDKIIDKLSVEMMANGQFIKKYEEQKENAGRIPIAIIGAMENESGRPEFDAGLKAAGERFRKKLFDSKLFDVKDDAILVSLARRIVASGNSATENGDLMEELKQHGSPDFFVVGNLTHFADLDGTGYYKFRVSMHSLRTGKIAWEGIETITGNGGSGK